MLSMNMSLRRFLLAAASAALLGCAALAWAAARPYDEGADARGDIAAAQRQAAAAQVPLVIVFGANWCGDCKMLEGAMKEGASAEMMRRDFRVVKVDVGRFNHNVDVAESYGVPLRQGIPAVAVLSPQGRLLYATRAGELADARKMGDAGVHDFFQRVASGTRPPR